MAKNIKNSNLSPEIQTLLKEYDKLKKENPKISNVGRKIRKQLRKLGYYLSKNRVKADK